VAHHLAVVFPERWVRFHSLPDGKRYPTNDADFGTILERHNRVLGALAQRGEIVGLLTTGWSTSPEAVRTQRELLELDPRASPWRTVAMHEGPDIFSDPTFWHIFASNRQWLPGVFDPLVRLVADDKLFNVMVVALDCKWLVHPYDGGMDVVVESRRMRDRLAVSYAEWLAPEWRSGGDARDVGLRL
jgi:hypothetical protein